MPAVVGGSGDELRQCAAAYRQANVPSTFDERRMILGELRLGTASRNESHEEARASFSKLMNDLADIPADILRKGCKAYVNFVDPDPTAKRPGIRFFPRSAAEVRQFTNPLQLQRSRRAFRLEEMAKAADDVFDPADRCTEEQAAAIMEEFGFKSESVTANRKHWGPARNPTREDYLALGVSPDVIASMFPTGQAA